VGRYLHAAYWLKYPRGLGATRVPSTRRSVDRVSVPAVAALTGLILVAFLGVSLVSQAETCTVPPALEAGVHAHPNAEVFVALGSWFSGNHKPNCAIDAFQAALRIDPAIQTMLARLGIERIGELLAMPRASWLSRKWAAAGDRRCSRCRKAPKGHRSTDYLAA